MRSSRPALLPPRPHCHVSIAQWNWLVAKHSSVLPDWSGACVTYRRRAIIPCAQRTSSCLLDAWRWVCRSSDGCIRQPLPGTHVQPGALIRRAFAHVGVGVRAQHVDAALQRLVVGALSGHEHDAWLNLVAHVQHQTYAGAVVDQADAIAVAQFACLSVLRMQHTVRRSLALTQERDPREGGVAEKIAGSR